MKMKRNNKLIILLGLTSLILMIMPIGVINIKGLKMVTLLVFKSKENSHQYLQFVGSFLGVLIPLAITFVTVDHQINKEKQLQVQIKLRDELYRKIAIGKKDIKLLRSAVSEVKSAVHHTLEGNKYLADIYNDKHREMVRDEFNKFDLKYRENMADFEIELEK